MTASPLDQLADAFRRRGMADHVTALAGRDLPPTLVTEWFRLFRIPPHEDDYPVLPRGAPCPHCARVSENRTATGTFVPFGFAGGWAERCIACHATWTHVERF